MDEVKRDFDNCDSSYQKLVEMYASQMEKIRMEHGGNVSDVPAKWDHAYWQIQNKLNAAHSMNKDGLLVKQELVIEENGTNSDVESETT